VDRMISVTRIACIDHSEGHLAQVGRLQFDVIELAEGAVGPRGARARR
jgi:hypothetical protein